MTSTLGRGWLPAPEVWPSPPPAVERQAPVRLTLSAEAIALSGPQHSQTQCTNSTITIHLVDG